MKASEAIAKLQALIAEHGDLDVRYDGGEYDPGCGCCSLNYDPREPERIRYTDEDANDHRTKVPPFFLIGSY